MAYAYKAKRIRKPPVVHSLLQRIVRALSIPLQRIRIYHIVIIAFAIRLAWGLVYKVVPFSDFLGFYTKAQNFSHGDYTSLAISKSPLSVIYYGSAFKIFGDSLVTVYLMNALIGALQVWLVYLIAIRIYSSTTSAKLSSICIALFPSVFINSSIVSSETPFATIMLLLIFAGFWFIGATRYLKIHHVIVYGILFGILIAMLHETRNIGVMIGLWVVMVVVLFAAISIKKKVTLLIATSIIFTALLVPQIKYNYDTYGTFSIHSSRWGALNLLMGTNKNYGGKYNWKDIAEVKDRYDLDSEESSRYAMRLALQRINQDRIGFLGFAVTKKFRNMWSSDDYSVNYSINEKNILATEDKRTKRINARTGKKNNTAEYKKPGTMPGTEFWKHVCNNYYYLILLLSLLGSTVYVGKIKKEEIPFLILIAGIILLTALIHIFIEVQARYHFHCLFLFSIIAGGIMPKTNQS